MTRFRLVVPAILTLIFAGISLSQVVEGPDFADHFNNPKNTVKIDEFGRIGDCDLSARVDNLFIQLNNRPDATAYVITYSATDFLPSEIESTPAVARIRAAIVFRRYDTDRLVFIAGGFRESVGVEFFLVPSGGEVPVPTGTVAAPRPPKGTFLWGRSVLVGQFEDGPSEDEFLLPEVLARQEEELRQEKLAEAREEFEREQAGENESDSETTPARPDVSRTEAGEPTSDSTNIEMQNDGHLQPTLSVAAADAPTSTPVPEQIEIDEPSAEELTAEEIDTLRYSWARYKFGDAVARRKGSRGVIVFYADDQYFDIEKLRQFASEGASRIATTAGMDPNRITVIFGGYREQTGVEYYVVPRGGKNPEPTPDERPEPWPDPN